MGILSKILSLIPPPKGIHLDVSRPFWEVSGDSNFPSLFRALVDFLPDGCTLYFEEGSPSGELLDFLRAHEVAERAHVAYGCWPKPRVTHVPAVPEIIKRLAELTRSCASPEVAIHLHVYRHQVVLLEWHDAFSQPMLLSGEFPEEKVRAFAERLHMSYERVEPGAAPKGSPATQFGNLNGTEGPPSVS